MCLYIVCVWMHVCVCGCMCVCVCMRGCRLKDTARKTISEHSMEEARKTNTVQAKLDVALVRVRVILLGWGYDYGLGF